jgi:hypothetical protein
MDLDKILQKGDTLYINEEDGYLLVFVKVGVEYVDITMRTALELGYSLDTGRGINLNTKLYPPFALTCMLSKKLFETQFENPILRYVDL